MATILSVASTEVLRTTRQLLLEQQGYSVCSATSLDEVKNLAHTEKVELALIGHGFPGPHKREIAKAVLECYPGVPILEMCHHSPEIPNVDFVLSDSPADLVRAVRNILEGRRVRGFAE
ncbi:MAG TPA: hypothetical protein VFT65_15410 [Candidatus Angelobacter sp.]|nr:hypothetical protein [Candidatus Angelobacter sp.]